MGLCCIPLCNDIEATIKSMGLTKAPDPDGLPHLFFQLGWDVIKEDVVELIQNFSISGGLNEQVNDANPILIQKKKEPISCRLLAYCPLQRGLQDCDKDLPIDYAHYLAPSSHLIRLHLSLEDLSRPIS